MLTPDSDSTPLFRRDGKSAADVGCAAGAFEWMGMLAKLKLARGALLGTAGMAFNADSPRDALRVGGRTPNAGLETRWNIKL
jgi:hypothetical protein